MGHQDLPPSANKTSYCGVRVARHVRLEHQNEPPRSYSSAEGKRQGGPASFEVVIPPDASQTRSDFTWIEQARVRHQAKLQVDVLSQRVGQFKVGAHAVRESAASEAVKQSAKALRSIQVGCEPTHVYDSASP
jgi:hypothetical protein